MRGLACILDRRLSIYWGPLTTVRRFVCTRRDKFRFIRRKSVHDTRLPYVRHLTDEVIDASVPTKENDMERKALVSKIVRFAMVPLLASAVGIGLAQAQDRDHGNPQDQGQHGNQGNQNRNGNNQQNHGNGQQNNGNDFRFRDQDRNAFQQHYQADASRWRNRPNRPQFNRGQRIPSNYRFQPVPNSYYRGAPPPPPGYQYGYYQGYVVTYNPTTRIIGDVLDLTAALTR